MTGIIFDIDGVVTDGTVIVDFSGKEFKRINMKDIDALNELVKRGYYVGAITAEKNEFTEYVKRRIPWNKFYDGISDKGACLEKLRNDGCDFIIYVGDGKKDISAFSKADMTMCPMDAISDIREKADIVFDVEAGKGGLWEVVRLLRDKTFDNSNMVQDEWTKVLDEHNKAIQILRNDSEFQRQVVRSADIITDAILNNNRVVIFGNGGSAADAQHIAAEYISRFQMERRSLDVEALTVNTSIITAVGNDYSFDDVFSRQIEGMTRAGDVAIGISTSGTSTNVRKALDLAKEKGVKTILLTGDLDEITAYDVTLRVKTKATARVQEMHIIAGHFWASYTEKKLFGSNMDQSRKNLIKMPLEVFHANVSNL